LSLKEFKDELKNEINNTHALRAPQHHRP